MKIDLTLTAKHIELDGVPTLVVERGPYLVGYLQAHGWVGRHKPSKRELAELDVDAITVIGGS